MHVFLWLPDGDIAFVSDEHYKDLMDKPDHYVHWAVKAEEITELWKDAGLMQMVHGIDKRLHSHAIEVLKSDSWGSCIDRGVGLWLSEISEGLV